MTILINKAKLLEEMAVHADDKYLDKNKEGSEKSRTHQADFLKTIKRHRDTARSKGIRAEGLDRALKRRQKRGSGFSK